MMLATSAFAIAWGPFILSQARERHDVLRARALTVVVAAAAGVMLVLVLFAPLFVRILAPESFESAARAVPGVALGWLFWAAATVLASEFAVMRRTRVIAGATLVAAAVNLALNLALVPQYGFVAAAWTTAASFATLAALYLVLERRTARPPVSLRAPRPNRCDHGCRLQRDARLGGRNRSGFPGGSRRRRAPRPVGRRRNRPRAGRLSLRCSAVTAILGLNAFHGDAAAALVIDGELVNAVEEERLQPRQALRRLPGAGRALVPRGRRPRRPRARPRRDRPRPAREHRREGRPHDPRRARARAT